MPPVVTALRDTPRGGVAVDLDGRAWRELPLDAVLRAGLAVGLPLDRDRARSLARERRRSRALAAAVAALSRRDLAGGVLEERLARRGVAARDRADAVATLQRAGLVDDARFAHRRAAALAERGWGDEAIRHRLSGEGLGGSLVDAAVGALPAESERAAALVARRGQSAATARFLARRGFGEASVEEAGGSVD